MDIEKDFSRNIWCLLGLTFDAIDMKQCAYEILSAANERRRCFLSTPNLNFLCGAQVDSTFRDSVINSELSIADGFPIVLIAKWLGIPLPERVAGSNLIEHLFHRDTDVPLKVFFFGGEPGVAERASHAVNQQPKGLVSVGYYTPGFGSVEDMSKPEIIDFINQRDVEFLIVAISAKKGQAWIEKNRQQLKAPVISHLGAVVNFFAGTVRRAPVFVQNIGFEWLWRIYQEPVLWKRYYDDGLRFLGLIVCNVLPYRLWLRFNPINPNDPPVRITGTSMVGNCKEIRLSGNCTYATLLPLRAEFAKAAKGNCDVILDLKDVGIIDSAFLGLCLLLYKHLRANGNSIKISNYNKKIKRILKWQKVMGFFALTN